MQDIFKFWAQIKLGATVHPADKKVFDRINEARHGFKLECLPGSFGGPLKTAPIVLLYLSPGYHEFDVKEAKTKEGREHRYRSYRGKEPFRNGTPGAKWLASRTSTFGDYETIRHKVAILNIGAYHSSNVASYASLLALPSSRVSLEWAQNSLFPEAEAGKRIVICMRSAAFWGLEVGRRYGKSLFAPKVTRHGHLARNPENERLKRLVRRRLAE